MWLVIWRPVSPSEFAEREVGGSRSSQVELEMEKLMRVVIMGNGILGNLGALYLRKRLPEAVEVVIVGPPSRGGLPVVGESTIEITARFLEEQLGLGQYLRKTHYPKFALTYYFKLDPDNPDDRRYSVHCNERAPSDLEDLPGWEGPMARPPSWQLNRTVFDRDIQTMVSEHPGIERIEGLVSGVALDGESGHELTIEEMGGGERRLEANWIVDGTGREQVLPRKLDLVQRPTTGQRDCFWFRLADFDRDLLKELDALGPMPPAEGEDYHYDRYYSTHHFMGRGNWIWMIPMRTADDSELISIGICSRPDVYEHEVKSMDDFLEHVGNAHPVITDLIKTGTVVDTNRLRNYRYVLSQAYSADRWCVLGDAAFAPDPLFSNGLAFGTIQLEQIGEMIARDCEGQHSPEYIEALDKAFWAPVIASQTAITNWYTTMHDAYLCSLRLNWIEIAYFYMLLPMVVNRCHYDPDRMALWEILRLSNQPFELPKALLDRRARFDVPTPEHFLYRGKEKVNLKALHQADNLKDVQSQIAEGGELRSAYTRDVLARIGEIETSG